MNLGSHQTKWIEGESVLRIAFQSHDGRVLGSETIYRQREIERDGQLVTAIESYPSATEHFRTIADAGRWIDDLRAREAVARVQLAGGTKLVFCV